MKYPIAPTEPKEPKKPEEYFFRFESIPISYELENKTFTYQELVKNFEKLSFIENKDIVFNLEYHECGYEYSTMNILQVGYKKQYKNANYKLQNNFYLKEIKEYPIKLEQYKKDLEQYNLDLEEWELYEAKKELKEAQSVLNRLTKAQAQVKAAESKIKKLGKNAKTK